MIFYHANFNSISEHVFRFYRSLFRLALVKALLHSCMRFVLSLFVRYGNGEIKLFSISHGRLLGEIGAHVRSVNAIHIAQGSGMVSLSHNCMPQNSMKM